MNTELTLALPSDYTKIFDGLDVSETTRTDYVYRLPTFVAFVQWNGFTKNVYLEYKRHLAKQKGSVATKNKNLIVAKVLLKEMHRQGYIPVDITYNVKQFKVSKKHKKKALSDREVKRLTTWLANLPDNPETDRLKAIFSVLLLQGLRGIELCRLDVEDINLEDEVMFVWGKGGYDKDPVPLMAQTVELLRRYMRTNGIKEGVLFRSNSNSHQGERLSVRGLREIVGVIFNMLDIHKSVHSCRHYYTTQLLKALPGQLLDVAVFTRHRSIEMLRVYDNRVKEDINANRVQTIFAGVQF